MKVLVTGSSGHLGEALVRVLQASGNEVVGIDIKPSSFTTVAGSIRDRDLLRESMRNVKIVYHTATLHKPHLATHSKQNFVETNVDGTLALLEESIAANVESFIYTSTTSAFGDASRPDAKSPTAWITENIAPIPRNIYGVSKLAAEDLCQLFYREHGLRCIVLRTSRFFPEEDDNKSRREAFDDDNLKANEFLYRRVELEDVVSAHISASQRAEEIGFARYIISATTPFSKEDVWDLRSNLKDVLKKLYPNYVDVYKKLGWEMFDGIGRVYVNEAARRDLGWEPEYSFAYILEHLEHSEDPRSELTRIVSSKGYHTEIFNEGPYPV